MMTVALGVFYRHKIKTAFTPKISPQKQFEFILEGKRFIILFPEKNGQTHNSARLIVEGSKELFWQLCGTFF